MTAGLLIAAVSSIIAPRVAILVHQAHGARLAEGGIGSSVGIYDNALAETIIGLDKAEAIHRREPWRSFEAVEGANHRQRQLLEPIGNIPPAGPEKHYYCTGLSRQSNSSSRKLFLRLRPWYPCDE